MNFEQRFKLALRRAGPTERERAKRIGRTTRALHEWERGRGIVPLLERLEKAGVIRVLDDLPAPTEQPQAHTA